MSIAIAPGATLREWLTREEAKQRLAKSDATLDRLVAAGRLNSKLEPRPGRKPERLYHAGDVERLAVEKEEAPLTHAAAKSTALVLSHEAVSFIKEQIAEFRAARNGETQIARPVPITEKLWLSLDEAVEYSGLAKSDLLQVCQRSLREQERNLYQQQPGNLIVRKSGGWKILRKSLEAFEG